MLDDDTTGFAVADPDPDYPDFKTSLSSQEETEFRKWVKQNHIPFSDSPSSDYDMRGYWKAQQAGDPNAVQNPKNLHFPDTYKTPFHKTFSNESQYATSDAPHWVGDRLIDKNGRVVADETPPELNTEGWWSDSLLHYPMPLTDPSDKRAFAFSEGIGGPHGYRKGIDSSIIHQPPPLFHDFDPHHLMEEDQDREQDQRNFSNPHIKGTYDLTPDYTDLTWDHFPLV